MTQSVVLRERRRDPAIIPGIFCVIAGLGLMANLVLRFIIEPVTGDGWGVLAYLGTAPVVGLGLLFGVVTAGLSILAALSGAALIIIGGLAIFGR